MITFVDQTGSTNADLLARLGAGEAVPEGVWLVARQQTAGRGRLGREWSDGAGNFMGSTVVRPAKSDPPSHSLALMTGLAVYESVLSLCPDPTALALKWPNDLLLGGAKLAGILLESAHGAVIVGIGVNLCVAPELPDRKTNCLADVTIPPTPDDFAKRMAHAFDAELERWRSHGLELLLRRWQAAAPEQGTPLTVHDPSGETFSGAFAGLDVDGSLLLRCADGKTLAVHAGDVMID